MPRFSDVGALLVVAVLLAAPVFAQKSAPHGAENGPRVERVVVRGSGDATEVEIQTSGGPVAPDTQAITGPDRIVVDFPGAFPAAELRALKVNRSTLKGIRAGLFFDNPPITRIVLDLAKPQSYQISATQNAIVVKLGPPQADRAAPAAAKAPKASFAPAARLQNAALATSANAVAATARISPSVLKPTAVPPSPAASETPLAKPLVVVTFENGMLRIRAERATLAQVLFEVQRQTQADIAIPAGAEQEEVVADLGPAPAREVLASLLNGSPYNFIFVGDELTLQRVILTRRDSSAF